jgi:hypothetical protein
VQCAVVAALRIGLRRWKGLRQVGFSFVKTTLLLSTVCIVLFSGMIVQVLIWAIVFVSIGEIDDIWRASYFSMVNFTSLGYGDIILGPERLILGPLEAANGILMLGLSTSALFSLFRDLARATDQN